MYTTISNSNDNGQLIENYLNEVDNRFNKCN